MNDDPRDDLTLWLQQLHADPSSVGGEAMRCIYEELKILALARLRGGPARSATLQATALVNEAWLRLQGRPLEFTNRRQYFCLASRAMRSVLVDHLRANSAGKRGGNIEHGTRVEPAAAAGDHPLDVLFLDDCLRKLESVDPELCRVVELRYFGGLEHAEIGEVLGLPLRTVQRRWQLARAWLRSELGDGDAGGEGEEGRVRRSP